ncbi:cytochrome C oxidase subunit III, partial [Mesorhizobium sp. M8A.F.Ca.ET.161.01.1.1]
MKERVALDVSKLPMSGNGTASPTWWGTCAFMLIEGTGFALAVAVYFYLMSLAPRWPIDAPPPDLSAGTVLTALLVVSVVPNVLVSRWARQRRLVHVRFGLVVMSAIGFVLLAVRAF